MAKYCKLSDYAKKYGVTYRTAFNRYNAGKLEGAVRDETNHICVPVEYLQGPVSTDVTIYATVASPKEQKQLDEQVQTLTAFCNARGYRVEKVVKEIASSIVDTRPKLNELLRDRNCKHIVVERASNVARFGFEYIQTLLETDQREIEVMNNVDENHEALTKDFVKVIYNICKTIGGKRIPKKTIKSFIDKLILNVEDEDLVD